MARVRPSSKPAATAEPQASRLQGFGSRSRKSGSFDWGEADPVLIAGLVVCVARLGGLASFGVTSDRGAGTVTVFLDGERSTEYIKPDEDVDQKLAQAVDYFHNLT